MQVNSNTMVDTTAHDNTGWWMGGTRQARETRTACGPRATRGACGPRATRVARRTCETRAARRTCETHIARQSRATRVAYRTREAYKSAMCVLAIVCALVMGLSACAQPSQSSSAESVSSSATASSSEAQSGSQDAQAATSTSTSGDASGQIHGKPWVTSIFPENLPAAAPEATDDLYLHYNFDFLQANKDNGPIRASTQAEDELRDSVTTIINDASVQSPELEQLRIFYEQARDIETREAAGADDLRPYLKAVADTTSLEELEQVMLADDFPFSPWIKTAISSADMKSSMCISILPELLYSDPIEGADIYQDTDDELLHQTYEDMVANQVPALAKGLQMVSLADDYDAGAEKAMQFFELEKTYGKEGDYLGKYEGAEYGAQAQATKQLSLDELTQLCPNFPLKETLEKHGEASGDIYLLAGQEWLEAFNTVWTEDNFETLHDMTVLKVLMECLPFIAPSYSADIRAMMGEEESTPEEGAYTVCDRPDTFGQLLAKTYVEQVLPAETADDLDKLTNGLIDAYIDLVNNTSWLNAESRENVMDKIDNMALNILEPDGGYRSFEALELTPSDQGGSLLGNYLKLKAYHEQCEAELIGQPARASELWFYYNPTLDNCAYDQMSNSINIFPGYVTSAIYSNDMNVEEKLGGIGFTIAHEISHAFDYMGSQFSAYGEPAPIYTAEDVDEFVQIRQRIADYYSSIEVEPDWNVDGIAVSTEATADVCGLQAVLAHATSVEGIDYEKLFGRFASSWAELYPDYYAGYLKTDMHPLSNLRVNVSAQMCDEFYEAYGVAEDDTMYLAPENRVYLWGPNAG